MIFLRIRKTMLVIFVCMLSSCSSGSRVRPGDSKGTSPHPSDSQYGPSADEANPAPVVYGPQPVQLKPVTLVFGPGMARAFAQVGVLRAFVENKIPIGAIYGAEMGSLMGALYAADSNINQFEWRLLKLRDDLFTSSKGFVSGIFDRSAQPTGDSGKLEETLKKLFARRDISQAKIPLHIEVQETSAPSPLLLEKGSMSQALRAAVATPGLFDPAPINGQPASAAVDAAAVTYLCAEARANSGSPVILVDTAVARNDPSAADLVIRPQLEGIGPTDFSKKTEAAFRGKKAVEDQLPELKRWVGMSDPLKSEEGHKP